MDKNAEEKWQRLLSDLGHSEMGFDFKPLRAMYVEFILAGFTEDQALRMLAYGLFHQPNKESE